MIYCFDIDGTLCTNTNGDYEKAKPYNKRIKQINKLYKDNIIILYTSRGYRTGIDWLKLTSTWFRRLKDKSKVKDIIKKAKNLQHTFKCQEVMVKLSIDWDGTISPCCLDYDQQLSVGNVKQDDLMDIWKSKEVKAIRDLLTSKRQDLFVLCSTCELNSSFRGKK